MDKQTVIRYKMRDDDEFLTACVKKLYQMQEEDEQASGDTRHQNGVGFNKADSTLLSDVARSLKKVGATIHKQYLPEVRKRMDKYAGQLASLMTIEEI